MLNNIFILLLLLSWSSSKPVISPFTTWIRIPQKDSAIIQSERVGGNFAYSTIEGHAYAAMNPLIENVRTPIGVNYQAHPLLAPAPIPVSTYTL